MTPTVTEEGGETRSPKPKVLRSVALAVAGAVVLAGCGGASDATTSTNQAVSVAAACENPHGVKVIEPGERAVSIFAPVEATDAWRACVGYAGTAGTTGNLSYQGGTADGAAGTVGVETRPVVYLVFWGSQWNNNDPSGEASSLQGFFNGVGGSSWANDDTQYCENVATGTVFCSGAGTAAGNQVGTLAGVWYDNATAAPRSPKQSQLADEAIRAAAHFNNLTATSNANVQYVVATATGNSSSGFGTRYCAWHSSTTSSYGDIAYTNFPYMTDAGASCGANFNGLGPNAGITIVGGHEFAESVTDPLPSSGWIDSAGSETGDKCAWISSGQGAAANVSFSTGTFPVQSLWSNLFNAGSGGCVLAYP